jgi:cytochrome P450
MPNVEASPLPPDFPMKRAASCPLDPPPPLRRLQMLGDLSKVRLWDGSNPWLVVSHEDHRTLLSDVRVSADVTRPGFPHHSLSARQRARQGLTFMSVDGLEHSRIRRMLTRSFSARRMTALRPAIQRIVDQLLDEMTDGPRPADLVGRLALPVPSLVICELLGVPYADHAFFQERSRLLVSRDVPVEQAVHAQAELRDFLDDLIGSKLAEPAGDLLSDIAGTHLRSGEITRQELADLGVFLLIAGHETTADMIALGALALLWHPGQVAVIREADDDATTANAVEELLRFLTVTHSGRRRIATEDIELRGTVIRAGDGIVFATDISNRDPAAFWEPDTLDVNRDARSHVAFGSGPHQCVGQSLARVELQIVYGTLFRRLKGLRLAIPDEDIRFKNSGQVYGVHELPVTWLPPSAPVLN